MERGWGRSLDIGAWVVFATRPDAAVAREAARSMVGIYASSMPAEQLQHNGVDPAELKPVIEAIAARDLAGGIEATPPELAEWLSISGTPQKCVEKIQREIEPAGVNHMILAITDAALVKAFTSRDLPAADVNTQLQLVHDEIMPAFT